MKKILVISNKKQTCEMIEETLSSSYKVEIVSSKESFNFPSKINHEVIFIDIESLGKNYEQELQFFWKNFPSTQVVILTSKEKIRETVSFVKAGADNYLDYPVKSEELIHVLQNCEEITRIQLELDYLRDKFWKSDLVNTKNPLMKKTFEKIKAVAPTITTVLLTGETGTGKGVLARLLHDYSNRSSNNFVSVHCGAIAKNLLESELFGHEKGAFTGAIRRKMGKFEIAKGGTIFLDEIGTITLEAQIKLLQVLQDKIFQRVGGELNVETDVRVIAATNADLEQMVEKGTFRKDLYYRLNIFPIKVPSLRERPEDIPSLAKFFLKKLNQLNSKKMDSIHIDVIKAFHKYTWPGNIRELENLIERAYIIETSSVLTPEWFPPEIFSENLPSTLIAVDASLTLAETRNKAVENIERQYLKKLLTVHKGKINDTAKNAGIGTRQLHKLLTKYKIRKDDFRYPETITPIEEDTI